MDVALTPETQNVQKKRKSCLSEALSIPVGRLKTCSPSCLLFHYNQSPNPANRVSVMNMRSCLSSLFLVPKLCLSVCNPMNRSAPGFPVLQRLPGLAQVHVHQVGDAIQPSHPLLPSFSCRQSFPASESFLMNHLIPSGGQSIGTSASVLPGNIQD